MDVQAEVASHQAASLWYNSAAARAQNQDAQGNALSTKKKMKKTSTPSSLPPVIAPL
jgi:hypothetical protein